MSTALAPGSVAATDAAHIVDVLARYAQAIDNRDWDDLASVFTPDFSFGSGPSAAVGCDALRAAIESVSPYHPHYSSNTVLHRLDDGRVKAWTKFLLVRTDGSTASGDYIDVVMPTTDGWRIAVREFSRGNRLPTDPGGASVRTFTSAKWRSVPR